jgi:hypothetical protein
METTPRPDSGVVMRSRAAPKNRASPNEKTPPSEAVIQ